MGTLYFCPDFVHVSCAFIYSSAMRRSRRFCFEYLSYHVYMTPSYWNFGVTAGLVLDARFPIILGGEVIGWETCLQ